WTNRGDAATAGAILLFPTWKIMPNSSNCSRFAALSVSISPKHTSSSRNNLPPPSLYIISKPPTSRPERLQKQQRFDKHLQQKQTRCHIYGALFVFVVIRHYHQDQSL